METVKILIKQQDCPQCKQTQRYCFRTVNIAGVDITQSYCLYCGHANDDIIE